MIGIKHFMDAPEGCDGKRIWVEPPGMTRDLKQWCRVDYVLPELGPPQALAEWFSRHPSWYRAFRDRYRAHVINSGHLPALRRLARLASGQNVTLLHQGEHAGHNTAAALREIIGELCPSQSTDKSIDFRAPGRNSPETSNPGFSPKSKPASDTHSRTAREVAAAIYEWQVVVDVASATKSAGPSRNTFGRLLSGCVRQLKACGRLIWIAGHRPVAR